jgi:hypothetical protein
MSRADGGEIVPQKLTPVMRVALTADPDEFDVTTESGALNAPAGSALQQPVAGGSSEWSWRIFPKKAGHLTLALLVDKMVKVDGYADAQPKRIKRAHEVDVTADYKFVASSFVERNWKYLSTSCAIPLIVLAFRGVRKRGEEKDEPEKLDEPEEEDAD